MTRIVPLAALLTAPLAFALPAHAAGPLTRTFVSSTGIDTNPCTIAAPCATFAAAYAAVGSNGIIAALDPGKYGPISITRPVTVNGNGWAAITAPAGGNGITISAGASDKVALTGLEIDGAGAGFNGISFSSGGSLTVSNCVLQDFVQDGSSDQFTGNGILMDPLSGTIDVVIVNTVASNNAWGGIFYFPPAEATTTMNFVVDHVTATANQYGVAFNSFRVTSTSSVTAAVSNTIASNNRADGFYIQGGGSVTGVSIDKSTATSNLNGLEVMGASVMLGRSVFMGNTGFGLVKSSNASLYSFQNNQVFLNTSTGAIPTPLSPE